MYTKLKLKIELEDTWFFEDKYYRLKITCLEKDINFESPKKQPFHISYKPRKYNLTITTSYYIPNGRITNDSFHIPSINNLNLPLHFDFYSDFERKFYLKKLYFSLMEWSNFWSPYFYDDKSIITISDNIWKVWCSSINPDF
jgi:hypothetical protein